MGVLKGTFGKMTTATTPAQGRRNIWLTEGRDWLSASYKQPIIQRVNPDVFVPSTDGNNLVTTEGYKLKERSKTVTRIGCPNECLNAVWNCSGLVVFQANMENVRARVVSIARLNQVHCIEAACKDGFPIIGQDSGDGNSLCVLRSFRHPQERSRQQHHTQTTDHT